MGSPEKKAAVVSGGIVAVLAAVLLLLLFTGVLYAANGGNPFLASANVATAQSAAREPQTFFGRNPFLAFGAQASPTPTGSGSPTPSVSPAGSPPPAPGGGSSIVVGGHTVVLDDVFLQGGTRKVQVEVDGVVYTAAKGQGFADGFKVTSIQSECADFTFSMQSFSLCETLNK
jgi:hypothetical protein